MENNEETLAVIDINLKKVAWESIGLTVGLSITGLILFPWLTSITEITFSFWNFLWFFIGYVVLIILHECLHLVGFWLFGKAPWNSMDYGVNLKMGVAYATTTMPIPNSAMKKALLLPFWATGFLPMIFGFWIGSLSLVLLGAWLIAGAAGDFAMYKELRKYPNDLLIKDDPVKPRLYVLIKRAQN